MNEVLKHGVFDRRFKPFALRLLRRQTPSRKLTNIIHALEAADYTAVMTDLTDEFFETALAGIQERLDDLITQPKVKGDPPDKWAKSFSALMKAEADAKARLEGHRAKAFAKQHTRYEDMPPPTPEDEARFHDRFQKIMRDILAARGADAGDAD